MEPWKEVAKSIIDTVKIRAKDFWDQNAAAQEFIKERAERLAKLTIQYGLAADDAQREAVKVQMAVVMETIEAQLLIVALDGQEASKAAFRETVASVFGAVIKILPVILSAV